MAAWKEHHYARAAEFVRLLEAALGSGVKPATAVTPTSVAAAGPATPAPAPAATTPPPAPTPAPAAPAPPAPAPAAKPTAASVFKNIPWKK